VNTSCQHDTRLPSGRLPLSFGVPAGRPRGWAGVLVSTVQARLPATPDSVARARAVARDQLRNSGLQAIADDAVQLVSELAANAVTAGRRARRADIVVRLALGPDAVRVAVANRAGLWRLAGFLLGQRLARASIGTFAESGRGLAIATAISQHTGWYRSRGWTIVWAELEIPGRASGRAASARRQVTCPGQSIRDRHAALPSGVEATRVT
jgi:anti-sigma regulatory factor (Ser/Thr protein kinase)